MVIINLKILGFCTILFIILISLPTVSYIVFSTKFHGITEK